VRLMCDRVALHLRLMRWGSGEVPFSRYVRKRNIIGLLRWGERESRRARRHPPGHGGAVRQFELSAQGGPADISAESTPSGICARDREEGVAAILAAPWAHSARLQVRVDLGQHVALLDALAFGEQRLL
jgi:hypothetical protein